MEFCKKSEKRKIKLFFCWALALQREKVIMHHRSIVHRQLTVNFKGPWLGGTKRKWSGEQTSHNDSYCWKSMPGKLDPFFQTTLLIHLARVGSRSECLGTGACLRGGRPLSKHAHTKKAVTHHHKWTHLGKQRGREMHASILFPTHTYTKAWLYCFFAVGDLLH